MGGASLPSSSSSDEESPWFDSFYIPETGTVPPPPPAHLNGASFSLWTEGQHGSLEIQITNVEVREVTFTAGSHMNTGAAAQSNSRAE